MDRKGSAVWNGDLQKGSGTVSTESGVLSEAGYGFSSRFEQGKGTNPEELLGAAHAGCFSMAFSAMLGEEKLTPEYIRTTSTVTVEKAGGGFGIPRIHLEVHAKVPGATEEKFAEVAKNAKENCPVSKLFNAAITMDATLDS